MGKAALGLAIYWIVGCLIVGQAAGMDAKACPNDRPWQPTTMVALVAIWPVALGYGLRNPHPTVRCDVGAS